MPFIEESDIEWELINKLMQERLDRLGSPEFEATEEAAMPFLGREWIPYVPWELMSPPDRALWKSLESRKQVRPDELLRLSKTK